MGTLPYSTILYHTLPYSTILYHKGTLNQIFFYVEICFLKVTKFSDYFWKKIYHKKRSRCWKKCLSHWVTVFKKKNVCHTESLCLRKIVQKLSKLDRFKLFFKLFDVFSWVFFNTVTQCDKQFFLKHSASVWQTFFY